MNYHLMIDEKFIDGFIYEADKIESTNNIYIFTFIPPSVFVKYKLGRFANTKEELLKVINEISLSDRVFIHYLNDTSIWFCNNLNKKIPVFLFFWGKDIVETPSSFYKKVIYDKLTLAYYNKLNRVSISNYLDINFYFSKKILINIYRFFSQLNYSYNKRKALKRINYFLHWNKFDFIQISNKFNMSAEYIYFYYDLELELYPNLIENRNIENSNLKFWIGNSATIANNHIDAFKFIKNIFEKQCGFELYCPLSYGELDYRDEVIRIGNYLFGDCFFPIVEYLEYGEYIKLLNTCDVFVMPHNRTQAAGNVFILMSQGKKVFLKRESTLYKLIMEMGGEIFAYDDLNNMDVNILKAPLSDYKKNQNKNAVCKILNKELRNKNLVDFLGR